MGAARATRTAPIASTRIRVIAALLGGSFVLQLFAAAQRWVVAAGVWRRSDTTLEDHRFDYVYIVDPWERIGAAPAVFGVAFITLAAAVWMLARAAAPGRAPSAVLGALGAAAPFGLVGLNALLSGLSGAPVLGWIGGGVFGLVVGGALQVVALCWLALALSYRSLVWMLAPLALIGSTTFGYLLSVFVGAPAVMGFESVDTTPWSEAVFAVPTLVAAGILLAGIPGARRRAAQD